MKKNFFIRFLVATFAVVGLHNVSIAQGKVANIGFTDLVAEPQQLSQTVQQKANIDVFRAHHIQVGQTQARVRQLLGEPVAKANVNQRQAWEYHLSLPLQDKRSSIVCQFMVVYNNQTLNVDDAYWRRSQCAAAVGDMVNIASDFLFGFDQYQLGVQGKQQLNQIVRKISEQHKPVRLTVVGHTDRLGDAAYNQKLSELRAQSVAQYLASQGIPRQAMRLGGQGDADPVVDCRGIAGTSALKDCLAPNRRVAVQIQPA